jgi:hypothetical protein
VFGAGWQRNLVDRFVDTFHRRLNCDPGSSRRHSPRGGLVGEILDVDSIDVRLAVDDVSGALVLGVEVPNQPVGRSC